jgi:hypothetical protein
MFFLLLIDYITSVLVSMSISMGAWVVYKTAGGVYYGGRWLMGGVPKQITEHELAELHKDPVVVLTEEEYLNLLHNRDQLKHIEDKLEKLEERIS